MSASAARGLLPAAGGPVGGAGARVRFTGRAEGDMGHGGAFVHQVHPEVGARRAAVLGGPWTWLRQVHGDRVVEVRGPGDRAGERADAAVTTRAGCPLAILTADCAPVALASAEGVLGAAHAGWRGVAAGVLERTVEAMRSLGARRLTGVVGPCIHAECYAFGPEELDDLAARLGPQVRARTSDGRPALDLPAAVRAALAGVGVHDLAEVACCTACSPDHFSWRARRERQRQAMVLWR